jgi:hypothetical protein
VGEAVAGDLDHRLAESLGRGRVFRDPSRESRADAAGQPVDPAVRGLVEADANVRVDVAGPEHEGAREGHRQKRVLRLAFDAGPHHPAPTRFVCAATRHVQEGQLRALSHQRFGHRQRQVVGGAPIRRFVEPGSRNAEAEETRVVVGKLS